MNKRDFNAFQRRMKRQLSPAMQSARDAYQRAKRGHSGVATAETVLRDRRTAELRKELGR